jgi:hypothetical protein
MLPILSADEATVIAAGMRNYTIREKELSTTSAG